MSKKLSKTARIWLIILCVIMITGAIFCTVWYTVPVDVLSKLDKFLDKSDEFYFSNNGRKYQISSEDLREIFHEELKDIKWVNAGLSDVTRLGDFLYIKYDEENKPFDKVIFRVGKVYIGHMVYKAKIEDIGWLTLLHKALDKAVDISGKPLV